MMAFFRRLRLLLWKNFTIKLRTRVTTFLELFLPLALCVLLVIVRSSQPIKLEYPEEFEPKPLPSAGWISLIESKCDNYELDENRFRFFPDSRTEEFLSSLDEIIRLNLTANSGNSSASLHYLSREDLLTNVTDELRNVLLAIDSDSVVYSMAVDWLLDDLLHSFTDRNDQSVVYSILSSKSQLRDAMHSAFKKLTLKSTSGRTSNLLEEMTATNVSVAELEDALISLFLNEGIENSLANYWNHVSRIRNELGLIRCFYEIVQYLPLSKRCMTKYTHTMDRSFAATFKSTNDESAALRYLWAIGEVIFCGKRLPPNVGNCDSISHCNSSIPSTNISGIQTEGSWSSEQENYVNKLLGSRLRIFYAPNGTAADDVIRKMNRTFELLEEGQKYAQQIINYTSGVMDSLRRHPSEWATVFERFSPVLLSSSNNERYGNSRLNMEHPMKPSTALERLELIQAFACTYQEAINGSDLNFFVGFKDEESLVNNVLNKAPFENITVYTSLIFNTVNKSLPPHFVYKIRQNVSMTPTTRSARALFRYPGPRSFEDSYYKFGFLFIQDMVERAVISLYNGNPILEPGSYIQEAPFPCFLYDEFLLNVESVFSLILSISWLYSVALLVQNIVYEKEKHLSEVMYVMGMNRNVLWASWFITVFIEMSLTMVLLTFLLWLGRLLPLSSPLFIFILLEEFAAASILMGIMLSTLYSQSKIATACGGIVFFMSCLPCLFISIREQSLTVLVSFWTKLICSLSSTSAFGMASKYLLYYEINGDGCNFNNFFISPIEDEQFTVAHAMAMMLVDCLLYAFIALIIDTICSSGRTTNFWRSLRLKTFFKVAEGNFRRLFRMDSCSSLSTCDSTSEVRHGDWFEADPEGEEIFVTLEGISKKFGHGAREYALRDLSLNLYKNEVTALLGHNGAGKTTAMNIITGMIAPTSGLVTIAGRPIRNKKDVLNVSLGTCPQHNVLFNNLTVYEHLTFYANLKSTQSAQEAEQEVEQMLMDLQLGDKRNELVDTLSGGMKRRLSVAIAFIGGSTTVILDEPTAGVDPFARRSIWELITKRREGRSIMIATHLMDEADILADRIAVISLGRLRALGSPLFLKQHLGDGYFLTVVSERQLSDSNVPKNIKQEPHNGTSNEDHLFSKRFIEFCSHYGRAPTLINSYAGEKTYQLREWNESQIIALLEVLEVTKSLKELGISSFGIRDTTLNEIFMKVSCMGSTPDVTSATDDGPPESSMEAEDNSSYCSVERSEPICLQLPHVEYLHRRVLVLLQQYFWILWKRCRCVMRSWKTLVSQLLLPAVFVAGGMSIALPSMIYNISPPIEMSTFQFVNLSTPNKSSTVYYSNEDFYEVPYNDSCYVNTSSMITSLYGVPGVGSDCLVADLSDTWLDANWPPNKPYLDRTVDATMLIGDCRRRRNFDENFRPGPLEGFLLPDYLPPTEKGPGSLYYPNCWCEKRGWALFCDGLNNNDNHRGLMTGDQLYDLTGIPFNDYIVNTANDFDLRFGGFSVGFRKKSVPYGYGVNVSDSLRLLAVRHLSKVWFNNRAFHGVSIFLNVLNNALLRAALRNNANYSNVNPGAFGITLINHPMEGSTGIITVAKMMQGNDVLIAVFLVVGMSFVPASFIYFLVYERASLSLHIQWMAGLSSVVYWFANLTWDLLNYCLPVAVCTFIIWVFNIPLYTRTENLLGVLVLLIMYGLSTTPLVYLMSFCFNDPSNAYIAMIILNLFTGIFTCFTSYLLQLFGLNNVAIASAESILRRIFLIFPGFCLGRGVLDIALNDYSNQYYEFIGEWSSVGSPFNWESLYLDITVMGIVGISAFILTIFCDCILHVDSNTVRERLLIEDVDEDSDVSAERSRVLCGDPDDDAVRVEALTKVYRKRRMKGEAKDLFAVDGIYLGVPQGECFGLLGVNGAGKTTAFKMMTRIIQPTSGTVYASGSNIYSGRDVLKHIGYCPQFDALYEELTAREHLIYYARIHGFESQSVKKMTSWLLKNIGLEEYADIEASAYSGGTKRKLSTAIALVGNPQIIFLDEPTTGMDPRARQFIQSVIKGLSIAGKSILLTSHSMEECEALCGRLSVMVNGKLRCLGTCQHLKDKYGDGYSIRLRLKKGVDASVRDDIQAFFLQRISHLKIKETHFAYVHMEVREVPLKILFKICSEASASNSLGIESYSVSQNNLDNVFISFVREQNESAVQANGRGASVMPCAVAEDPSSRKNSKWELTHKKASSWQEGIPSTHSTDIHSHSRPISNSVSEILR
uniref:ABC transporter domain-containing protein n=3 Tax=Parascaris univalens TaxID=6257 RepID=A0A914ZJC1_PARUN